MVEFTINLVIAFTLLLTFLYNSYKYGSSKYFNDVIYSILATGSIYLIVSPILLINSIQESNFYLKYFLVLLTFVLNYSVLLFMLIKDSLEK